MTAARWIFANKITRERLVGERAAAEILNIPMAELKRNRDAIGYVSRHGMKSGYFVSDLHRWSQSLIGTDKKTSPGKVYFIQCSKTRRIKIGYTESEVEVRLAGLQTGSPTQLEILGHLPGDRSLERRLHELFASARLHGEWFELSPDLQTFLYRWGWLKNAPIPARERFEGCA